MNKVTVNIGLAIRSVGGGIIESVSVDTTTDSEGVEVEETTGSVHLKLEDGEYGAIAVGDLCMGLWHDMSGGNATEDVDNHKGSFAMRGFKTVYFRISEIPSKDENGKDKLYYSSGITITNCNLHHNRRNNLSITEGVMNLTRQFPSNKWAVTCLGSKFFFLNFPIFIFTKSN